MVAVQNYITILKQRLEERCRSNPRYSLRAFSRDLGIHPSRLSQILNGKQGLSEAWARKISQKLGFTATETEHFCDLVIAADSRSKTKRTIAKTKLAQKKAALDQGSILEVDAFRVISDWHHFAILELTRLENFKSNPSWISRRLGITRYEVESAIQRLKNLELLEEKDGKLVQTETHLTTTNGITSEAIQKFNLQILEKAIKAIRLQSVEQRDISTLTVAINTVDLPRIKAKIREFRKSLNQELEQSPIHSRPNAVYCLATQFFELTEKEPSL